MKKMFIVAALFVAATMVACCGEQAKDKKECCGEQKTECCEQKAECKGECKGECEKQAEAPAEAPAAEEAPAAPEAK